MYLMTMIEQNFQSFCNFGETDKIDCITDLSAYLTVWIVEYVCMLVLVEWTSIISPIVLKHDSTAGPWKQLKHNIATFLRVGYLEFSMMETHQLSASCWESNTVNELSIWNRMTSKDKLIFSSEVRNFRICSSPSCSKAFPVNVWPRHALKQSAI